MIIPVYELNNNATFNNFSQINYQPNYIEIANANSSECFEVTERKISFFDFPITMFKFNQLQMIS